MKVIEFETDKKIGQLGESTFSTWCSTAELTSNRSLEEDRTGWDHQVEFPYIKTHLPRDKQLSPIQCRVQVKSTQRRDRSWSIKASVLKRLIDYSYPSFFLFLEFTNTPEPVLESAFLVHIDKKIIERTLKALRRNDTQKFPKELYELKISISYSKKHQLMTNTGEAFRGCVLTYVEDGDISKYQKTKSNMVETIGYDKQGSYKMKFEVSPNELNKHIIERSIGLSKEPLQIRNSVLIDNRFNLKNGSVEIERSNEAKLTVEPNIIDICQLRFKETKYSPSINFDGEFISSTNIYSAGKNKLFFRTNLFSFELGDSNDNGEFEAKLHFTLDKKVPLDDVIKIFRLYHEENVGKELICEVELFNKKRTLIFKIGMEHDFEDARDVASNLHALKDSFGIDGATLTTVDEMFLQRDRINALTCAIQNKADEFKVNFENELDEFPDEIKTPYTFGAKVGNKSIGAIVLLYGSKIEDNSYQVTKSEVLQPLVFSDASPTSEQLNELEKQAIEKLEDV